MGTYTFLRELADSWALLAMTLGFLAICVWAFLPGNRAAQSDAANSIFRNEKAPAEAPPANKEA